MSPALRHLPSCALAAVLCAVNVPSSLAQTPAGRSVYAAVRFGGNLESTDPGAGTSAGAGGSVGMFFTGHWAVEVEAWVPGYITDQACGPPVPSPPFRDTPGACGPGQFRDLQLAVSAVRHFGGTGMHPYVVVGASKLWTQSRTPQGDWTNNEGVYPQGGAGLVIPLTNAVSLVPELRFAYLALGGILRPSVGLVYRLR
jgi:hypothetical protein